jgi:hypothetical protein
MADTEDLKSSGPKGRAGSNPALGIARSSPCGAGTLFTCSHFSPDVLAHNSQQPETRSQPMRAPDGEALYLLFISNPRSDQ